MASRCSSSSSILLAFVVFLAAAVVVNGGNIQFFNALPPPASIRVMYFVNGANDTLSALFWAVDYSSSERMTDIPSGEVTLILYNARTALIDPLATIVVHLGDSSEVLIGAFGNLSKVQTAVYSNTSLPVHNFAQVRFINSIVDTPMRVSFGNVNYFGNRVFKYMDHSEFVLIPASAEGVNVTATLLTTNETVRLAAAAAINSEMVETVVASTAFGKYGHFRVVTAPGYLVAPEEFKYWETMGGGSNVHKPNSALISACCIVLLFAICAFFS